MVAFTVLVGGVLGAFVLDIGSKVDRSAPMTTFDVEVSTGGNGVHLMHDSGDSLVAAQVKIIVPQGNDRVEFISADSEVLTSGDSFNIDTDARSLSGWSGATFTEQTGSGFDFDAGDDVTVTVIDTEGQKLIFETTVTA